jgi:hypothetical protein
MVKSGLKYYPLKAATTSGAGGVPIVFHSRSSAAAPSSSEGLMAHAAPLTMGSRVETATAVSSAPLQSAPPGNDQPASSRADSVHSGPAATSGPNSVNQICPRLISPQDPTWCMPCLLFPDIKSERQVCIYALDFLFSHQGEDVQRGMRFIDKSLSSLTRLRTSAKGIGQRLPCSSQRCHFL